MADNLTTPVVDGTDVAAKDIGGVLYPRNIITDSSGNDISPATTGKQDTIIGHLDGVEGLLTTIDADTGALAGAVSGTEMQVDVVAALPAGDNNIGNVDLASAIPAGTNNIGDVDVLTINGQAPAFGSGVRGAAVLRVTVATDDVVPVSDNGGSLTVDGSVSVSSLPALAAGTNNIGDVDVLTINGVAPAFGSGARGATVQRVTIATDDVVPISDNGGSITVDGTVAVTNTALTNLDAGDYETVAASQTDQTIGPTGGANDLLAGLLIVPATTSPGAVSIKDGAGSAITVFTGGASSVTNLVPFFVPLGIKCATAWKVTTGANVSVIAVGNFT